MGVFDSIRPARYPGRVFAHHIGRNSDHAACSAGKAKPCSRTVAAPLLCHSGSSALRLFGADVPDRNSLEPLGIGWGGKLLHAQPHQGSRGL